MKAKAHMAAGFLRALGPPRTLVAIEPDSGRIIASTPTSTKEAAAWIARLNATHGVYYSVNRARRPMTRKPAKADMAWADFAHVELDPPASVKTLDEWRDRLRYAIAESMWPPTWMWNSGNGIQGLWQLESPVRLDGDAIARVEAINRRLLQIFSGDDVESQATFNIDRILRIPFTTNWPNAAKRKAGRKAVLAGEVHHDPARVYTLNELPTVKAARIVPVRPLSIGDAADVVSLRKLNIPDRLKTIIRHGRIPGQRKRPDDSRSVWEWDCLCGLVRHGVKPETILGILLNPEWEIGERVQEHRDPEAFARKEIERAHHAIAAQRRADFPDSFRESRPLNELIDFGE